jgi:hypothetical protein
MALVKPPWPRSVQARQGGEASRERGRSSVGRGGFGQGLQGYSVFVNSYWTALATRAMPCGYNALKRAQTRIKLLS